eukprot:3937063-Rhodomonas_salina.2
MAPQVPTGQRHDAAALWATGAQQPQRRRVQRRVAVREQKPGPRLRAPLAQSVYHTLPVCGDRHRAGAGLLVTHLPCTLSAASGPQAVRSARDPRRRRRGWGAVRPCQRPRYCPQPARRPPAAARRSHLPPSPPRKAPPQTAPRSSAS